MKLSCMNAFDSKQGNKMPRWLSFVSHEALLDGFLALGGEHSCKQEVKLRGGLSYTYQ